MIAETSPALSIASGCLKVAGTAALVAGLCWTLSAIEGPAGPGSSASADDAPFAGRADATPMLASGFTGQYDRGPDLATLETFGAACERKLNTLVARLGETISPADRAGLVQHMAQSLNGADPRSRRIQAKFHGRDTYDYACTKSADQPVLALVNRSPG